MIKCNPSLHPSAGCGSPTGWCHNFSQFSIILLPDGVISDSGWNCIPRTSYRLWRIPIIIRSSLSSAVISSTSEGNPSFDTTHE